MNPWECNQYKEIFRKAKNKSGISIYFGKTPDELKNIISSFITWLETKYEFPITIYIDFVYKNYLRMSTGRKVNGIFGWDDYQNDVRITIAIKEYPKKRDIEDIILTLIHELTHYMEWINKKEQSQDETDKYCIGLWVEFFDLHPQASKKR